jgi:hypothetical protein
VVQAGEDDIEARVEFGLGGAVEADGTFLGSILGPSMVASIGAGLCFVPLGTAATSGVAASEAGMAGGLINSSRQIGGSIGLAALVTLSASVIAGDGVRTVPRPIGCGRSHTDTRWRSGRRGCCSRWRR